MKKFGKAIRDTEVRDWYPVPESAKYILFKDIFCVDFLCGISAKNRIKFADDQLKLMTKTKQFCRVQS